MTIRRRQLVHKFFADRGTHLAAMVAYFALLSFVPLVFLTLSLFGLAHRAKASDFFIRELKHAFPGTSVDHIINLVHHVQNNAAALGIIGGVGLLWSSLSFVQRARVGAQHRLRIAEPALLPRQGNRSGVDGESPDHPLHQPRGRRVRRERAQAPPPLRGQPCRRLHRFLRRLARSASSSSSWSSIAGCRTRMSACRRRYPARSWARSCSRSSFLALPFFVRHASVNVTLRTLGGPAILLLWMYVMANVMIFGGELNWWWRERRRERAEAREPHEHGGSAPPSTHSPVPQPSAPRRSE